MATKEEVSSYLNNRLKQNPDTVNAQWYVGIASDVRDRLFNDHNVHEQNDQWTHATAHTNAIARQVEADFLGAGCDGGKGGGDSATKTVYVYLKSARTDP